MQVHEYAALAIFVNPYKWKLERKSTITPSLISLVSFADINLIIGPVCRTVEIRKILTYVCHD